MYTEIEREKLARQYMPLVKKISYQLFNKSSLEYEEVEGYAWEGFVLAMNKYDPERSNLSFKQYAAWSIRNSILNGINADSRTIKVSYYKQKQMKENEQEMPFSISLEKNFSNDDHLYELGFEDNILFDNPWEVLIKELNREFKPEWVDMFLSIYGIDGRETVSCKELAKKYNISPALITVRKNKMIKYIQSKQELLDVLYDLM